ncbi:hypothetical protein GGTG_08242 [Gaeumannomyces tritici R3-111a-1]|uniref:Uncharacterized protein n=1 Tax=Gaeumannomyces tritici (strain R3-111a-1) TaxID=644352 RepID=J3P406_GAET3|nr:hypothetical protein GGTG_08242 [Gaeumannomyces tritici R3-111a-1]EJT74401.1 hypothetical protein GGTG_08242 [Gaeumannomyces tritici R3-111a-1]
MFDAAEKLKSVSFAFNADNNFTDRKKHYVWAFNFTGKVKAGKSKGFNVKIFISNIKLHGKW